jgi:DNA-binding CsgD family transcriptional regulator
MVGLSYWLLFTGKDMRRKTSKLFLGILLAETLQILFSIAAAIVYAYSWETAGTLQYLFSVLSYLCYYFVAAICAWYFLYFIGIGHKFSPVSHILFYLPYLATSVVPLAVPLLRSGLFVTDQEGALVQGPTAFTPLTGLFIYIVIILIVGIRFHGRLSREQGEALFFLIAVSTAANLIANYLMKNMEMSLFFVSMGLLVVLNSVDNRSWVYSGTTNVYNRLTFHRHILVDFEDHNDFDIIIIQMSREAYFDATAMRAESFQYLMNEISGYLKGIKNRPNVYYCERGTFLIPVFRDSRWQADALAEMIRERFAKPWAVLSESAGSEKTITIPVRIVEGHIPTEIATMQQLSALIDLPYDGGEDGQNAFIIRAGELYEQEQAKKTAEEKIPSEDGGTGTIELPKELTVMLDNFAENMKDLTPAERRIVRFYLNGYEISEIPEIGGITINTVRKHNKNIYRKLHINSREELMMYLDILDRCGRLEPIEEMLEE